MSLNLTPSGNKNMPSWVTYTNKISLLGSYVSQSNIQSKVRLNGKNVYLTGFNGFFILDVSILSIPKLIYSSTTNRALALRDNSMYQLTSQGLQILDISNPSTPIHISSFSTFVGFGSGIELGGNYAYLFQPNRALMILDISNSTSVKLTGSFPTGYADHLIIRGRYVYLLGGGANPFRILDVYTPNMPLLIGSYSIPFGRAMALRENSAYIANGYSLEIVDISNPSTPRHISSYTLTMNPNGIAMHGSNAYISCDLGLLVVDISDSKNPSLIVTYSTRGSANDIVLSGNNAFVATDGGLQILDIAQWILSGTPSVNDVGTTTLNLVATDTFGLQASGSFKVVVEGPPLLIGTIPSQVATAGKYFSYFLGENVFIDRNNYVLTFTANIKNSTQLPRWLSFNQNSAIFGGTPNLQDIGDYVIELKASNRVAAPTPTTFNLSIKNPPSAGPIEAQIAKVDHGFNYTIPDIVFIDIEGSALTYSASLSNGISLPQWLQFFQNNKTFFGIPAKTDVGNMAIRVVAEDVYGNNVASVFSLAVYGIPEFTGNLVNQTATAGKFFSYYLGQNVFIDPNNAVLYYRANVQSNVGLTPLPKWLSFNPSSLIFAGNPDEKNDYDIVVQASNQITQPTSAKFHLRIKYPPIARSITPQVVQIDQWFNYTVPDTVFSDDPGSTLIYSAILDNGSNLPSWLLFFPQNKTFIGTPSTTDVGTLSIRLLAQDEYANSVYSLFNMIVNAGPQIQSDLLARVDNQTAFAGKPYSYSLPNGLFFDRNEVIVPNCPRAIYQRG
jgi:hypothetical protein